VDLRDQLQHTLGDRYTLERELGGGGMSRVFVATESALGRRVVVKVVPSAMANAHAKGIVHRDIKPDNVLISGGTAMVTDFGVAKALSASSDSESIGTMTSLGVALGTPAFMATEQAAASPNIDARADIYAWGIMAYELFAGRSPFSGRAPVGR
jgi:serine/threonine-protein kinase